MKINENESKFEKVTNGVFSHHSSRSQGGLLRITEGVTFVPLQHRWIAPLLQVLDVFFGGIGGLLHCCNGLMFFFCAGGLFHCSNCSIHNCSIGSDEGKGGAIYIEAGTVLPEKKILPIVINAMTLKRQT